MGLFFLLALGDYTYTCDVFPSSTILGCQTDSLLSSPLLLLSEILVCLRLSSLARYCLPGCLPSSGLAAAPIPSAAPRRDTKQAPSLCPTQLKSRSWSGRHLCWKLVGNKEFGHNIPGSEGTSSEYETPKPLFLFCLLWHPVHVLPSPESEAFTFVPGSDLDRLGKREFTDQ